MNDNFNKFCGVLILLLLGLSTLFTLRASAEEYDPPAEDSTQTVTDSEETHKVVQVQGVQTYDPTLYEKLDALQESVNSLVEVLTPSDGASDAADPADSVPNEEPKDYSAQLSTISEQLVDLRTTAEMATAETAEPAAFDKSFADYSVSEVLLLVLAAVVVGAIVIGLVRGF